MTRQSIETRLANLARPDKWYLSAGDGILWAPPFPTWLHAPGFWDEAHVYYHPFAPVFSVALVDEHGRDVPLRQIDRVWSPSRLRSRYTITDAAAAASAEVVLVEDRIALPRGRFTSCWSREDGEPLGEGPLGAMHLVMFTAQPGAEITRAEQVSASRLRLRRALQDRREQVMEVDALLCACAERACEGTIPSARVAAVRSEPSALQPHWRLTPFGERWEKDGLRQEVRLEGISTTGLVYAAVDVPLGSLQEPSLCLCADLVPVEEAYRLPPEGDRATCTGLAAQAAGRWQDLFSTFPAFSCADAHLARYFDYRLYGLHLCRLEGGAGNVRHPCIAEGISYFHVPITYSGQCHMFEMRWSSDPRTARGTLLNFLDSQKEDGSFHGRLYTNHLVGTDFYHANWGDAALAVDAVHPSNEYLDLIYERLGRYAAWLDSSRDREGSGMYDVINHFETGQEYMSRYQAVNPKADEDGWKDSTQLKAIDATVYVYQLKQALATIALRLGRDADAQRWREGAARVGEAILGTMWDTDEGLFSDVDPRTMERTRVKAAVCFYPLLTELITESHLEQLLGHLRNPEEFATPWPVPSSSVDDRFFNADAEWKGKRHVCPWNGRVWPMTNSHMVDGLIRQWQRRDLGGGGATPRHRAGTLAGELLTKFIHLMFHDRDLARPNCFEHYNPYTGHACEYRGIDDYQHSWVVDLLIRGVCGLEPLGATGARPGGVRIDPLPMDMDFEVGPVQVRGRQIRLRREGAQVSVEVGRERHETTAGSPLTIPLT